MKDFPTAKLKTEPRSSREKTKPKQGQARIFGRRDSIGTSQSQRATDNAREGAPPSADAPAERSPKQENL